MVRGHVFILKIIERKDLCAVPCRELLNFNTKWLYIPEDCGNYSQVSIDESSFEKVSVPHAKTSCIPTTTFANMIISSYPGTAGILLQKKNGKTAGSRWNLKAL